MKRFYCLMAILMATPATAQEASTALPDLVGVKKFRDSGETRESGPWRQRSIDWHIDANGNAMLAVVECPQCHLPRFRRTEFAIGQEAYDTVAALLPADLVDAAIEAPCTLPHAHIAWNHRIDIFRQSDNRRESREFFEECSSPQLDDLKRRIAEASRILLAGEPPAQQGQED